MKKRCFFVLNKTVILALSVSMVSVMLLCACTGGGGGGGEAFRKLTDSQNTTLLPAPGGGGRSDGGPVINISINNQNNNQNNDENNNSNVINVGSHVMQLPGSGSGGFSGLPVPNLGGQNVIAGPVLVGTVWGTSNEIVGFNINIMSDININNIVLLLDVLGSFTGPIVQQLIILPACYNLEKVSGNTYRITFRFTFKLAFLSIVSLRNINAYPQGYGVLSPCEPPGPVGDEEICYNSVDDDKDGQIDCEDSDCDNYLGCSVCRGTSCPQPLEDCTNGRDDDGDKLIDCFDPDCSKHVSCKPKDEICDNGKDDDANGKTDCEDPACANHSACGQKAEICDNAQDDDGDGKVDCDDPDCAGSRSCSQGPEVCVNGEDDDGDGKIDCDDSDCASHAACSLCETRGECQGEICNNGKDDDGDDLVDCADPACNAFKDCNIGGPGTSHPGYEPPIAYTGRHYMFSSSYEFRGVDLGGLEGADRRCQLLAEQRGTWTIGNETIDLKKEGYWRAILSNEKIHARDRIRLRGPVYNPKGQVIATWSADTKTSDFWTMIETGTYWNHSAVGYTEQLAPYDATWPSYARNYVWTGTEGNGLRMPVFHCNNWSAEATDKRGGMGHVPGRDRNWLGNIRAGSMGPDHERGCNLVGRLYCISGQPPIPKIVFEPSDQRIFVTPNVFNGQMVGGRVAANEKCAFAASIAGLNGSWKAMLGDDDVGLRSVDPANPDRIKFGKILKNMLGEVVMNLSKDGSSFYDHQFWAPIMMDQYGKLIPVTVNNNGTATIGGGFGVWTGVKENGYALQGVSCNNWTNGYSQAMGKWGSFLGRDGTFLEMKDATGQPVHATCNTQHHLYCIDQQLIFPSEIGQ